MKNEVARNLTGYVLLILGIAAACFGETRHLPELTKTGGALVGAALLAFQTKRNDPLQPPPPPPSDRSSVSDPI